ncbi:alpha-2-macroglobulin domain-containing protein [Campylobacter blaseri]|uniref:Alpha-2-macroglobulin domain-containing protein n=1 Tax=Campylobacter blaseri TaxID=2042961 RepID=A0A2P8QYQ8_9BACT|nr:alpha-2-macroglobulin family protein [Campylobacter blaseri]PSM51382.1 hypothetical protein CQ405_08310 [Campylobacter blaseri]PSM52832.1 hypothetical protein CRN67_08315 [Campylobacter blaseri]QKF86134.1 alpha-2-macroglobulin domain-containing protein [Campylobacter blaseri]
MVRNLLIVIFLTIYASAFNITGVSKDQNGIYVFGIENLDNQNDIGLITHDKIIACDPDVSGAFEYLSADKIAFYPNRPLAKGINYICGNANGRISFNTEPFKVENIRALDDRNFILSLNDKTDLNELRLKLKVYTKENSSKNDIPFKVDTSDNLNFLIKLDSVYDNLFLYLPKSVKSKANVTLQSYFEEDISKNKAFYKDSPNAVNFKDVKVVPFAFDDGVLGFKIKTREYVIADKRFVKISGIKDFSLSPINYFYDKQDPDYYYEFNIKSLEFKPNTEYKIDILPGFGDEYLLNRELKSFSLKTTDIKPFAKFSDDKPYIPKTTDIAFKSANLNSVKVVVDRVSDQNLRYFLNYKEKIEKLTKSVISKNFELSNNFNEISEHRINLDFSGFEDGIYNISLYYKDEKDDMKKILKQVYLSDISALTIVGDSGIFVFTSRVSTAKALPNTNIVIYNENNEILARGRSDEKGVHKFENSKILDKNPRSIFIKNGNEENFLILDNPINDNALIMDSVNYKALTYFATDIIRPNENIEGIIVLKDYDFNPVKNLPVKIKIIDPQGKTIKNLSKNTDDFGVISIDEMMGDLTGRYTLNVEFANKLVDSKKFSVESFIPQRVKSEILTKKEEFIGDENIDIALVSNYLFGAPASNLSGSLTANFSAKELKLDDYRDFSFINSILDSKSVLDNRYFNLKLNKDGKKDFIVKYSKNIPVSNAINLNLNFSVLDSSKTISEYKNLTIYPYKTLTGIKGDRDFIDSKESVKFELLSLDSFSKKRLSPNLNISIYQISWNYVLSDNNYEEQKEINLVDSFGVKEDNFTYKFENGGNYVVVANDYLNGSSASFEVYVSGWGGYGAKSTKDMKKAKITFNKDVFSPDDEIKVNIISSIKDGTAIISLVDEKVLDYQIVEFKDNKALASFKLPKDFKKGHINATIIRDTKPLATPLRTYANKSIKVNKSAHKAELKLKVPSRSKNNEPINIKVKTDPNSKIAIFIVDEGVLQIVNQKELDAFKYFDITMPINVYNYDIYDLLSTYISNAKALSFGGDAMLEMARKRDLNPVKAKDLKTFKIVKYLMTDEKGEASFSFKSPVNFNSKVRVTAISLNEEKINSKNRYTEVKDDVVIKPSVMTYLTKGDELDLPITIINTTNEKKDLKFDINSSPNLNITFKEQNITLKPLESVQIKGKISALNLGNAKFTINLTEDESSKFNHITNLNVISPYPNSRYLKNGFIETYQDFNISDDSYKTLYINTSSSPKGVFSNLAKEIIKYPYGCTEQISTKILAMANLDIDDKSKQREIEDNIKSGITTLISRLKDNGSFGYWSKFSDTNILASIYTSDVLLKVDKDRNLLGKSQKELIFSYLKMPHQDPFHTIYSAYILNEYKKLSISQINYLFDNQIYKHNLVTLYMMAAILKDNGLDIELSSVISEIDNYNFNDIKFDNYNVNFDSNIRNIAFALYIHSKHFKPNEISENMAKFLSSELNNLNSTQKKAFVLRAFNNYFNKSTESIKYTISLNGESKNYDSFADVVLNMNDSNSFKISTDTPLYYSLLSFGNEKLPIKHTLPVVNDDFYKQNEQIHIYRDFVDIDGNRLSLNELKLNQTIFSKATLLSNRIYVPNVLVDEQISSCFEVVNERIFGIQRKKSTKDSISFEYKDIKDYKVINFLEPIKYKQVFYTPLKVIMSGKCKLPAIKVELMQNEDLWDYDLELEEFEVKD